MGDGGSVAGITKDFFGDEVVLEECLREGEKEALFTVVKLLLEAPFRAVGPREPERVYEEIVLDSLAPAVLSCLGGMGGADEAWDVGCGAGIPTIPLALLLPDKRFLGIDSTVKKVRWGREMARRLELRNCRFVEARLPAEYEACIKRRKKRRGRERQAPVFFRAVGRIEKIADILFRTPLWTRPVVIFSAEARIKEAAR
ncbi:MAG: methyltransferase domain-containing protein, partial [Candidatus Hydrogenedentota bacterium]